MKRVLSLYTFIFLFATISYANDISGRIYEHVNTHPWSKSMLFFNEIGPKIETQPLSDVILKIIRGYNHLEPEKKDEDYLEVFGKVKPDGAFSISADKFSHGDKLSIVVQKKNYIQLWHFITYDTTANYSNISILMVPLKIKE